MTPDPQDDLFDAYIALIWEAAILGAVFLTGAGVGFLVGWML